MDISKQDDAGGFDLFFLLSLAGDTPASSAIFWVDNLGNNIVDNLGNRLIFNPGS
jgi:hypothetical protein